MSKKVYNFLLLSGILILAFGLFQNFNLSTVKTTPRQIADNFALIDSQGEFHTLDYYSDMKAVVLISQSNGCPIIRKSVPYLKKLKAEYGPQGVVFLMINANRQDDRNSIQQEAADFGIDFPILEDTAQVVSEMLGISRTAEALVITPADRQVIYHGAVHDQFGYETSQKNIKHQYLRDVLEAILTNQPVRISKTEVKGCLINYEKRSVTYTNDVAPILAQKCVICHTKGGVAPWSMDNYAKVRTWGPMIQEVIMTKRMPPWHADQIYGSFKNDLSLNPDQVSSLIDWTKNNFPRGTGDDVLEKRSAHPKNSLWQIEKPDLIFKLKEPQKLPPDGPDEFRFIEADRVIDQDIWIKAVEIKPGNSRIVHHGNLVVEWPDTDIQSTQNMNQDSENPTAGMEIEKGSMIAGYSPGTGAIVFPEGTGIFVPKGSKLQFRLHYIKTGKPEEDLTQAGLYLLPTKPAKTFTIDTITNRDIQIPPGEKNYRLTGSHIFENNVSLVSLQPHMHYRGKSMKFTVHYPDGKSEIVLSVPNYKFQWQRQYIFEKPLKLPKGTRIELEGVYDNSAQNPNNPNPDEMVEYGPYSSTEMFTGIMFYTIDE